MNFGPRLNAQALRDRRNQETTLHKLAQTQSDIYFLTCCKKLDIVPKGLRLKNPLSSSGLPEASRICEQASVKLRNVALKLCYRKQRTLTGNANTNDWRRHLNSQSKINGVERFLKDSYSTHVRRCFAKKNAKLRTLSKENILLSGLVEQGHPFITHLFKTGVERSVTTTTNSHPNNQQVINLTDEPLSDAQLSLLNKGLSFCPTTKIDDVDLSFSISRFNRRVRLKEWAHTEGISDSPQPLSHPQLPKREWTPGTNRNRYIDCFTDSVQQHLRSFLNTIDNAPTSKTDNLSKQERRALKELSHNKDLVIKPADKGGAVVLQTRENYIREAYRQLADGKFYSRQSSDQTKQVMTKIHSLTRQLGKDTQEDIKLLLPPNPNSGHFYLLPKWHKIYSLLENIVSDSDKPINNSNIISLARKYNVIPPGRPIVSGINTPTEYLSAYVDRFLQPLLTYIPSYIQDTTHFLRRLQHEVPFVQDGSYLVTLDVSSLYTNIPHEEGIIACRELLLKTLSL
ncbi:hypothetical protein HOLleu_21996 [Holothuria leucospilota]|uniref:Reverse transcriptase n=1 Tax=Holothuria leucospilota TaxID=206669 RepID=A0A9Q1BYP0_HOLLE|nr:hypothetical protein HOLleu_21996 [Holothuria leucospilota]